MTRPKRILATVEAVEPWLSIISRLYISSVAATDDCNDLETA